MFTWLKNLLGLAPKAAQVPAATIDKIEAQVQKAADEVKADIQAAQAKAEAVVAEAKTQVAEVEAQVAAAVACGCGRSATGFCVGLHKLSDADWAVHPANPGKALEQVAETVTQIAVPLKKARVKVAKAADAEPKVKKPRAKKTK